jgi:hypothetical protein
MNYDDYAALIEIRGRLDELRSLQDGAKSAADWGRFNAVQAQIEAAEAEELHIMRRTEPADDPKL